MSGVLQSIIKSTFLKQIEKNTILENVVLSGNPMMWILSNKIRKTLQLHNVSKNGGAKQTKLHHRQNNIPDLAMTHLEMRQQFIDDVWMDILNHQKHDENR